MRTQLGLVLAWVAMVAAVAVPARVTTFPPVAHPWLPEVALLGPRLAAAQDAGHRMRQADPQSYCWRPETSGSQVKQRERDPHAHRCYCHLTCQVDSGGQPYNEHETPNCTHFCVREACTCHVEEPCEMPQ